MYLITGCNGQLGTEIRNILGNKGVYLGKNELDITNTEMVENYFKLNSGKFKTIINCSAYTNVDEAEDNSEMAKKVNVIGVKNLAQTNLPLIHISTDFVFDGLKNTPYKEEDKENPISIYGKTKLAGEKEVLKYCETYAIIRTSWLYSPYGNNFLKTMMRLGSEKERINVVFDQVGTPTYAKDLAEVVLLIADNLKTNSKEIYNFSNEGVCSWYDFSVKIIELSNLNCKVIPIESKDYPTKAKRPAYSVLNKDKIKKTFNVEINHWEKSLENCIKEIKNMEEK